MSHIDYSTKPEIYFGAARRDFIDMLPLNPTASLLEIGCGNGATAAYALKTRKCGAAVGVELCSGPASEAASVLGRVLVGDAETMVLDLPESHFDILIMSEVLEHLRNPESFLQRIVPFLKPGAIVISGSPNVCYWSVIWMQIRGRWDYAGSGIMDFTHLRWFTARTYAELFSRCGFAADFVGPARRISWRKRVLDILLANSMRHILYSQILYIGRFTRVREPDFVKESSPAA
ncbi:MAG: class I SAM-dependent methyltransferase [Verrucomicrobia bacterium]|nr:class I SAM-dependent methyltransferase [Verrucomicrobiota bacterium]